MATYYVKNGGNDSLAGTSDATAWATITKVNAYSVSPGFNAGDSILFKCGDLWRLTTGEMWIYPQNNGTSGNHITFSSYGTGAKPFFMSSKEENSTGDWVNQGGNIWKNSDSLFSTAQVANIVLNNNSAGWRVYSSGDLTIQGRWLYDFTNKWVLFYSTSNPASYYTDIECALGHSFVLFYIHGNRSYITIDGLNLSYHGEGAILMSSGADNITIRNCDVKWIGGKIRPEKLPSTTRYGSGITNWGNCQNILIENCYFEQILDDGTTPQHYTNTNFNVTNWRAQNNIYYKCDSAMSIMFVDCIGTLNGLYFENNTVVDSGRGWSYAQKTGNKMGYDFYIVSLAVTNISNIYIRNNILSNCLNYVIRGTVSPQNLIATAIVWDYNLYHKSGDIAWLGGMYYDFNEWKSYSGDDAHSLSDNPDFVSATDYHLTAVSPAINAALDVGIDYDYDWNLRDVNPDIGAYEYIASGSVPTLTTTSITSITTITATSGGNVTSEGGSNVTARGVCWNTTGSPTTADDYTSNGTGAGVFVSYLTGLIADTTYYVRAYATNALGTAYGNQLSFTTAVVVLATVSTTEVTVITETTANSGGNITNDGGGTITLRGVCWSSVTSTPTTADSKTENGTGSGSYVSNLTGMTSGVTYYVRAYAINSAGTAYGSAREFITLTPPLENIIISGRVGLAGIL